MSRISEEIRTRLEEADLPMAVVEDGDRVLLAGMVNSERQRDAAIEIAEAAAPDRRIETDIEVVAGLPEEVEGHTILDADQGDLRGAISGTESEDAIEPGDFTDQDIEREPAAGTGPSGSLYEDDASEGEGVWVPPIDPVTDGDEVIGGLQLSSMDSVEVERSASDGRRGDEALADAVRRELREDAITNGLALEVEVVDRVAYLRGAVSDIIDAESAQEVAARVPGLLDVIDETEVESLR